MHRTGPARVTTPAEAAIPMGAAVPTGPVRVRAVAVQGIAFPERLARQPRPALLRAQECQSDAGADRAGRRCLLHTRTEVLDDPAGTGDEEPLRSQAPG